MNLNISVEVIERARPPVRELTLALKNGAANPSIGRAVVALLRKHFLALPPNKRGFPTTHFWRRAAKATSFDFARDWVRVSVKQTGVRQRLLGGHIDPIRSDYLTIPAIAETYGHRAGDFSGLKVVRGDFEMYTGRHVWLALAPQDWKRDPQDPTGSAGVFFWLVNGVNQDPDPSVLPTIGEIRKTALQAAANFFRRLHKRH
jgi:hypothetical protein